MTKRTFLVGVAAGAAAGLAMAAVEMIYGWASSVHTAWDAPMGIWAYIGGLNHFGRPVDHIGPIVLGIGGHMLNAILVGIVFVALVRALRNPSAVLIASLPLSGGWRATRLARTLPLSSTRCREAMARISRYA